jgi:hypothetical protein
MLHLPQKHKATVPDSTLRVEMKALESKLTTTRPACFIGSPSHGSGPSGPPLPMTLGISRCADVCLHDPGFGGACTHRPLLQPTCARPVRLQEARHRHVRQPHGHLYCPQCRNQMHDWAVGVLGPLFRSAGHSSALSIK